MPSYFALHIFQRNAHGVDPRGTRQIPLYLQSVALLLGVSHTLSLLLGGSLCLACTQVWSLSTQRTIARCVGHTSWLMSVAFDPFSSRPPRDLRLLSTGQDGKLLLWDVTIDIGDGNDTSTTSTVRSDKGGETTADVTRPSKFGAIEQLEPVAEKVGDPLLCSCPHCFHTHSRRFTHVTLFFALSPTALYAQSRPPTHPLTHSLAHSLARSLDHSITHSPTHPPTHSLTRPPTQPLTHSLTHSLTHPPTHNHHRSQLVSLDSVSAVLCGANSIITASTMTEVAFWARPRGSTSEV
jgi:hypothetical protein